MQVDPFARDVREVRLPAKETVGQHGRRHDHPIGPASRGRWKRRPRRRPRGFVLADRSRRVGRTEREGENGRDHGGARGSFPGDAEDDEGAHYRHEKLHRRDVRDPPRDKHDADDEHEIHGKPLTARPVPYDCALR